MRRDWFSLLNQGYLNTATTNTDTHTLSPELAGYPLSFVFLPPGVADGPRVDAADLARAVRAARLVGTDGPVPMLTVQSVAGNGNPGDLVSATSGEVEASVEVLTDGTPLPGRYGQVAPRGLALGFTKPVFTDVDGNSRFDAPGLQNAALPDLPPE